MKVIDKIYFWYCKCKVKHDKKKWDRKRRNRIISSIARNINTNRVVFDSIIDNDYSYDEVKDMCTNLKVPFREEITQWSKRIFLDYVK